jgi:hypothetical protein
MTPESVAKENKTGQSDHVEVAHPPRRQKTELPVNTMVHYLQKARYFVSNTICFDQI